jgi:thiol-disulfide isomerase/thioredoxin
MQPCGYNIWKITSLISISFFFLIACKDKKTSSEIVIEGQINNIPDGKIYLTEAHHWQVPLDSTICKSGSFKFRISPDSAFVPYMASINFPDSSTSSKVKQLLFRNYMLGDDSMDHSSNAFYLEKGHTRIEGDNAKPPFLRVFAGKETDIMYRNERTDFGWLGNLDTIRRSQRIASFKKQIKSNPYSYFLLQHIYNAKEQYSKEEIYQILALFDKDVERSRLGEQFKMYLTNRPDTDEPFPNLSLLRPDNQRQNIISYRSKVNMLVFWASWCGPCRIEIPALKEIHAQYKREELNIVSISIDEKKDNWTKALDQEKMLWEQYIVDSNKIDEVQQQFNFSAIPLVVFTDNKGKEIKRFIGYEKEQKMNYLAVIKKFIK